MKKKLFIILSVCILTMLFPLASLAKENQLTNAVQVNDVRVEYWARIYTTSGNISVPPNTYVPGASAYYVRLLQCCLNKIEGINLATDGVCGINTRNAISTFQEKNNLDSDGVAGRDTWNQISSIIKENGWKIRF